MSTDPICTMCRRAFNSPKSRDAHGYAEHGLPSVRWKGVRSDLAGVEIEPARTPGYQGKKKATTSTTKREKPYVAPRNDRYASLLKDKPQSEAEKAAKDLPWLKMPRSARVCEKVADECADLASKYRADPELRDFYVGLREHLIALANIQSTREKALA